MTQEINKLFNKSRIIFDFGANDGVDIAYYLKKADIVIAIEANETLCRSIEKKYKSVLNKRLFIENCIVTDNNKEKNSIFYFSKKHSALSTFIKPKKEDLKNYTEKK